MNYASIKKLDIANGPGIRLSLFVSGCRHNCPGCFNQEAQDFNYGKPFTDITIREILDTLSFGAYAGITYLGGEPLEPENQGGLLTLSKVFKETFPDKDIWCYTGFTYEYIMEHMIDDLPYTRDLLSYIDVLVDGPFIEALKNISLAFRGSENQRLIDVKKTLKAGEIILWEKKIKFD